MREMEVNYRKRGLTEQIALTICQALIMELQSGRTHSKIPFMSVQISIDRAGRVVIPKTMRDDLHLEPGDLLEMETAGEQITLRPVRGMGPLRKEHGVWVFYTGNPLPASATDEVLQELRADRDRANLGQSE